MLKPSVPVKEQDQSTQLDDYNKTKQSTSAVNLCLCTRPWNPATLRIDFVFHVHIPSPPTPTQDPDPDPDEPLHAHAHAHAKREEQSKTILRQQGTENHRSEQEESESRWADMKNGRGGACDHLPSVQWDRYP